MMELGFDDGRINGQVRVYNGNTSTIPSAATPGRLIQIDKDIHNDKGKGSGGIAVGAHGVEEKVKDINYVM